MYKVLAVLSNVPILLMGDFDVKLESSCAIQGAKWIDTCKNCATAQGKPEPDATCFVRATSVGTRIDGIFANSVAGHMIGEAGVLLDTSLPTHLPVAVELRMGDCSGEVTVVRRPKRIPLAFADPDLDAEACVADRVCRNVLQKSCCAWSRALACKDVEALWQLWCIDAESYLCSRASLAGLRVDTKAALGEARCVL